MSTSFYNELNTLSRARKLISLLPEKLKFRVAKKLYNYEADSVHGIDIVAPLHDMVCFINTKDLIGWKIFFFGEYEADTNRILSQYIKKGDVVIEAGANIGSETLLISRIVGGTGYVYAFEPNPYTFERLGINISINELSNVSIHDIAMGESNGEISFNIYPKNFCNPGMSSKYMETSQTKKITVAQNTLDTFIREKNIEKVDLIKMDIQGAEMDMIQGADETIKRFMPTIFTEAYDLYNDVKAFYGILSGYGYKIYHIGTNKLSLMGSVNEARDGNWIATAE